MGFYRARRLGRHENAGFIFSRRILNAQESCAECVFWAKKGFIPVEEQPGIGELLCRAFCKCTIDYEMETNSD